MRLGGPVRRVKSPDTLQVPIGTEAYGLGGRRLGRGPVTEKRGCAKKKVVTPLPAWHVQDDVRVTSKSSSESG